MTPSPKIENKDLMKILLWYKIALVLKTNKLIFATGKDTRVSGNIPLGL